MVARNIRTSGNHDPAAFILPDDHAGIRLQTLAIETFAMLPTFPRPGATAVHISVKVAIRQSTRVSCRADGRLLSPACILPKLFFLPSLTLDCRHRLSRCVASKIAARPASMSVAVHAGGWEGLWFAT